MFAQKLHYAYFLNSIRASFHVVLFLIGIHSMKAEQPLQGMVLQEKEAQKD